MAKIDDAKNILNTPEGKAMLDLIAFTEGTAGVSQNGYDVMNNFYKLIDWTENTNIEHNGSEWRKTTEGSSAFGRYQFLEKSWKSTAKKLFNTDNAPVSKRNQDLFGAWKIYQRTSKTQKFTKGKFAGITIPQPPSIGSLSNISNFTKFIDAISPEWASLPFSQNKGRGFYSDQDGGYSISKLYDIFNKALAKYN